MKNILFILCLVVSQLAIGQTYEVINSIFANNKSNTNLYYKFVPLISNYNSTILTRRFFEEEWAPIKSEQTPDINLFLSGISINHLESFSRIKDTTIIDETKLSSNIILVQDLDPYNQKVSFDTLNQQKLICRISIPFISHSKDWAIIFYSCSSDATDGSGDLYIYRKLENKWIYYHKINLFIP